jgi:hypothetical protein
MTWSSGSAPCAKKMIWEEMTDHSPWLKPGALRKGLVITDYENIGVAPYSTVKITDTGQGREIENINKIFGPFLLQNYLWRVRASPSPKKS